jgi:hypothetical protein
MVPAEPELVELAAEPGMVEPAVAEPVVPVPAGLVVQALARAAPGPARVASEPEVAVEGAERRRPARP